MLARKPASPGAVTEQSTNGNNPNQLKLSDQGSKPEA
jgi:hypothetical protein